MCLIISRNSEFRRTLQTWDLAQKRRAISETISLSTGWYCMIEVMKSAGRNNYKIPHMGKAKLARQNRPPVNLSCPLDVYETAQASLNSWTQQFDNINETERVYNNFIFICPAPFYTPRSAHIHRDLRRSTAWALHHLSHGRRRHTADHGRRQDLASIPQHYSSFALNFYWSSWHMPHEQETDDGATQRANQFLWVTWWCGI